MKLSRRDKVVTTILVLVILILIYIMQCHWRNRFGSRGEAKPVGEVEYKYHQVQRKFSDRMLWEDVESKSPIYAYDWVMTKDKSDARITLNGGMKVDMDPESMVEIDENRDGVGLTLRDGTIRADTRGSKSGTITGADGTKIDLDRADVQISTDGRNISVDVKEGNARLKNRDKESQVGAGEIGNVNAGGMSKEKTSVALKSPRQGIIQEDGSKDVEFNFDPPPDAKNCNILLSSGGKRKRTIPVQGKSHKEKLPDGSYQWRVNCEVKGKKATSSAGAFRVRPQASFALLSPAPDQVITANQAEGLVLRWRSTIRTRAELSQNSGYSPVLKASETGAQSLAVPNLKPGKYFWRVYPAGNKDQALTSSFTISEKGELLTEADPDKKTKPGNAVPEKKASRDEADPGKKTRPGAEKPVKKTESASITARSETKVTIEPDAKSARVPISWSPVNRKYSYRVRVATDKGFSDEVASEQVSGKGRLVVPLKPGIYYYRVAVRNSGEGRPLAETLPQRIEVKQKKLPSPPRVKSVQAE